MIYVRKYRRMKAKTLYYGRTVSYLHDVDHAGKVQLTTANIWYHLNKFKHTYILSIWWKCVINTNAHCHRQLDYYNMYFSAQLNFSVQNYYKEVCAGRLCVFEPKHILCKELEVNMAIFANIYSVKKKVKFN